MVNPSMISEDSKGPIKQNVLERRITNKFKQNLGDKLKKFGQKKKIDMSHLFESVEFKAAVIDIKNLCMWNSGAKKISPLDLIRAMKPLIPHFPDGVSKEEFISILFSLDVDSDRVHKRKIREIAMEKIFKLVTD